MTASTIGQIPETRRGRQVQFSPHLIDAMLLQSFQAREALEELDKTTCANPIGLRACESLLRR